MLSDFHFIRPYWLLALLPLILFSWVVLHKKSSFSAWSEVCSPHLLPHLIKNNQARQRTSALLLLLTSVLCMIISLSGPSWSRDIVSTYQPIQPRVLLLNLSKTMLMNDLSPDRLSRAKFKLHDLFVRSELGQFGLIVYTGEPFVVSPLTEDGQTIDSLLHMLSPKIMPVGGSRLEAALSEAEKLITQAGFFHGNVLVLTSDTPTAEATAMAKTLNKHHIDVSIMPVLSPKAALNPLFSRFASAGGGRVIPLSSTSDDMESWLKATRTRQQFNLDADNKAEVWQDQGRWFIIPALLLLLPVFRRGWVQRIMS